MFGGPHSAERERPRPTSPAVDAAGQAAYWSLSRRPSRRATAAASVRERTPSLARMLETCTLTVFSLMYSSRANCRLVRPRQAAPVLRSPATSAHPRHRCRRHRSRPATAWRPVHARPRRPAPPARSPPRPARPRATRPTTHPRPRLLEGVPVPEGVHGPLPRGDMVRGVGASTPASHRSRSHSDSSRASQASPSTPISRPGGRPFSAVVCPSASNAAPRETSSAADDGSPTARWHRICMPSAANRIRARNHSAWKTSAHSAETSAMSFPLRPGDPAAGRRPRPAAAR